MHDACTTITFATANRASLPRSRHGSWRKSSPRRPIQRSEIKRQVVAHGARRGAGGGSAAPAGAICSIASRRRCGTAPIIAGSPGIASLADAAATPYVWRLDKLKLARLWDTRPGVAAWYQRIRQRPSFKTAVEDWVTPADHERYAKEPRSLAQGVPRSCARPDRLSPERASCRARLNNVSAHAARGRRRYLRLESRISSVKRANR